MPRISPGGAPGKSVTFYPFLLPGNALCADAGRPGTRAAASLTAERSGTLDRLFRTPRPEERRPCPPNRTLHELRLGSATTFRRLRLSTSEAPDSSDCHQPHPARFCTPRSKSGDPRLRDTRLGSAGDWRRVIDEFRDCRAGMEPQLAAIPVRVQSDAVRSDPGGSPRAPDGNFVFPTPGMVTHDSADKAPQDYERQKSRI